MSNGKKRPTAALVLGIICIAFGILGTCGGLVGLVGGIAGLKAPQTADVPANVQMGMHLLQGVSFALHVMLLISGIGLIQVKNWARILSMIYAVLDIPLTIVSTLVTTKFVLPILEKSMPPNLPPEAMKIVIACSMGGGVCCGLIYPIVLLVVLNLKSVREAFTSSDNLPPKVS